MGQFESPPAPASTTAGLRTGGDPLLPHLAWEGLLLIGAVVSIAVMVAVAPSGGPLMSQFLIRTAVVGLLASGVALSLRTAAPNLAVGTIAAAAGLLTAHLVTVSHWSVLGAGLVALVVSGLIGAVLGVVTGVLSVPGWAVTFGAGVLITGILVGATESGPTIPMRGSVPSGGLWFALFCVISLGGGAVWLVPAVRRTLSAGRAPVEPATWRLRAALGPLVGLTVSSLLAGLSGILEARAIQAASVASTGDLAMALGAVLLGGVSIFGRRAGVAGTLFAVLALSAIAMALTLTGKSAMVVMILTGVVILVGLGVSRLLELFAGLLDRGPASQRGSGPVPAGGPFPPPGGPQGQFSQPGAGAPTGQFNQPGGAPSGQFNQPGGAPSGPGGTLGAPPAPYGPPPTGPAAGGAPQPGPPAPQSGPPAPWSGPGDDPDRPPTA